MARVFVEKPKKVHAEQYVGVPIPYVFTPATPFGLCATSPIYPGPHVHGEGHVWELHETDWITVSVAFPDALPEVLTDPQFVELYGATVEDA
jgi:hypothetical protein